ncbi:MAG TPA: cysteine desulfurase [Anaeromyxobacteraceae bacterium]|nr:cysteine desulfurase [Anaeromyxobacteraceae bacterium]
MSEQVAGAVEEARGLEPFDVARVRREFPILAQRVHGKPLVYLDSGATAQKPQRVIDAVSRFYEHDNANVHRGVYALAERATAQYERARERVARFLGAADPKEIVFVRGATEALNLVAQSYGRANVGPGDEILVTAMEHHSNIVPWQMLAEVKGASLKVAPVDDRGVLDLDELERLIGPRTRIVALTHVSNALGTVNPVRRVAEMAHARGAAVVVDGAQAVPHLQVNVAALGCDFYVFSGHKVFGPTGIGALYGKASRLEAMPPWQGGGDMILSVTFERTLYNRIPYKFEAGTPDAAGAVGLGAALDWLGTLDRAGVRAHEEDLVAYGAERLSSVPGLQLVGTAPEKVAVFSFVLDGVHPHDVGTILDREGVAVRAGHHCAQPLMQRFGVPATVRASLALYNTRDEIDALVQGLGRVREMFR